MLLPAAVDDYVSSASPVCAIDAFVDILDLLALGFKTRNDSSESRCSYHPGSLLKLYLWGYLKRTRSSRGLEKSCAENLQAIWLTGNLRPDHSTKSPFRKLLVSVHHAVIVRSRQRLAADPTAMRQRASLVEHPFSIIKNRHGYTGRLRKGIKQASAEMNLSAWAYNFTRVVNLVGLGVLLGAIGHRNAPPLA